jgi:thiaminase
VSRSSLKHCDWHYSRSAKRQNREIKSAENSHYIKWAELTHGDSLDFSRSEIDTPLTGAKRCNGSSSGENTRRKSHVSAEGISECRH